MAGVKGRSGGARVGAGRKPLEAAKRFLSGGRDRRKGRHQRVKTAAPAVATVQVDPPATLTKAELEVWRETSPHVMGRTLIPSTAADFAALCSLEVEMVEVLAERRAEGWTTRGMFLAKEYRGLVQRVEAKRRAFKLAPMGKDMVPAEEPKDEWSEFDQGLTVIPGGKK